MKNIFIILLLMMVIVSCNNSIINSQVPAEQPLIDGILQEWEGILINPEGESLGFGVMNDNTNLYLSMTTYDRQVVMKVLRGFTIWIDPTSKKNKSFGIKYPLEHDIIGMTGRGFRKNNQDENFDFLIQQNLSQQNNIVIIKEDLHQYTETDNGEDGIKIKMIYDKGDLTYEMKIPLNEFNLESLDKISICLESTKMQRPENMPNRGSGGKPGGDMGGSMGGGRSGGGMGGGMRGGRRGGRMPGGMQGMMDPIELWIKIKLIEANE